ncbi:hypothetical protein [Spirochaeta cellobiosiphila]|uniref:hypothetical protein n=1 Tax=Spirochaeta cellobiosiphila TaxID=504483 RepID=UPI00048A7FC7|nr:hypothetical protein [Spirochaeta cellobiosiphila]
MKKFKFQIISLFLLILSSMGIWAQEYQSYFDEDCDVVYPDTNTPKGVVILIPYTTGTSQEWYTYLKKAGLPADYVWVLPPGRPQYSHYLPDFTTYIENYEKLVIRGLQQVKAELGALPKKRVLMGYSLGGDLSWALSNRNPTFFSYAIVMGSRCSYAYTKGNVHYFFSIGNSDAIVRRNGMGYAYKLITASDSETPIMYFKGAHELPPDDVIRSAFAFFDKEGQPLDIPDNIAQVPQVQPNEANIIFTCAISQGMSALYYLPEGKTNKEEAISILEYPLQYLEKLELKVPVKDSVIQGSLVAETTSGTYIKPLANVGDGERIKMTIFSKTYRW